MKLTRLSLPLLTALIVTTTLSMLVPQSSQALPEDRDQPVQIEANMAERDDKTGKITYTGDVEIHQGTIIIVADKVVLETQNDEFTSLIATGSPAQYQQKVDAQKGPVNASANTIRFLHSQDLVVLDQNAVLKQDGSEIRGNHIEYDMKDKKVKAGSASSSTKKKKSAADRITVIVPPSKSKTTTKGSK